MDMNKPDFGHWLQVQRASRGLTQREVEEGATISHSHYSRIENGRIGMPDASTRKRIHAVLGTSDDDLVEAGILDKTEVSGREPVYLPAFKRVRIGQPDDYGRLVTRDLPVQGSMEEHRQAIAHIVTMLTDREVMLLRLALEVFADYHLRPDEPQ